MSFGCPTVLHHHYPPFSHHPQTCPPRRRGSSGWAWCWILCADARSFGGTGSRPSPGTRGRGSRFQRRIVEAPYGFGLGLRRRDEPPLGPDFVGRSGARHGLCGWSHWVPAFAGMTMGGRRLGAWCIVDAPYGFGGGIGQRGKPPLGPAPDHVRGGRSGTRSWSWWVEPLGSRFRGNDDGGGRGWGVVHL